MKISESFILKFFESSFKDISKSNWFLTNYYYVIDSKYRISKRLDLFLKEQLINPNEELVVVAKELRAKAKTPDELIINILKYVKDRITYETDQSNYGQIEKWANAYEVWNKRKDDCDGLNSLIYILARLAGISDLVLWSVIGETSQGGHYWLIYFSTRTEKWYSIDATYYPNLIDIKDNRTAFKLNDRYKSISFLFNEQFILKQKNTI